MGLKKYEIFEYRKKVDKILGVVMMMKKKKKKMMMKIFLNCFLPIKHSGLLVK
jgi:hypothetical protein